MMINLMKVEGYKLRKFSFGYLAMLFMFVVGYLYGDSRLASRPFDMTSDTAVVFSSSVCDTSFVFLIAIASALFLGKDFSGRTICNEIKLGYSRFHVLLSRMVTACAFSCMLHVIYVAAAVLGFSLLRGFDAGLLQIENAAWLFTVLLQLTAVISGVVFISFLTKKVSEAIALSALYGVVCCNILRNYFLDAKPFTLSCFCFVQSSSEGFAPAAVSAVVTIAAFLTMTMLVFRKAEIK